MVVQAQSSGTHSDVVSSPLPLAAPMAGKGQRDNAQRSEVVPQVKSNAAPIDTPRTFEVNIQRKKGDVVGAVLGNTKSGAVVISISEGGILDQWNANNPYHNVRPGFIVEEVNGQGGYWNVMKQMRKLGNLTIKISQPPADASPSWFEQVEEMARAMEKQATNDLILLKLQPKHASDATASKVASLQCTRASDCGVDQCAICLEDVLPNETLVQLPCTHAFHRLCVGRWLEQSMAMSSGRQHSCPLCCRKLACTGEGEACFAEH